MAQKFNAYQSVDYPLPSKTILWNMYGAGLENVGKDGKPEIQGIPEPDDDQLLVRIDAVGMCFSDVKLIKQGGEHPKLYHRNLQENPTRLGHEAAMTVIKVGKTLADQYHPGQRLALQPDIYQNKLSTAYGYTIPGGLIQYHLVGDEILSADDGAYVIPIEGDISYAESALTEPWACVIAAYTQRRRLEPKLDGTMWILGNQDDQREYEFSTGLDAPKLIVLSDVPADFKALVSEKAHPGAAIVEVNNLELQDFSRLNADMCVNQGFDDIILLAPSSAEVVSEAVNLIAFRGTFNIIADQPLDGPVDIDAGRIHYHYTAYYGNQGPDIAASYGEKRNRSDLLDGGTLIVVGAGGPMGQMHIQRAIEMTGGPKRIIASDVNQDRLSELEKFTQPIAKRNEKEILFFNPSNSGQSLLDFLKEVNKDQLADDIVVCVPSGPLMESSFKLLAPNGMLVLFAGAPIETKMKIDISHIFINNQQLTGTSGSTLDDQRLVIQNTVEGQLSPILSVAAVGGMEAAVDGLDAMMTGKYAGKVVIFPQVTGLPLTGLNEMDELYPDISKKLGENNAWTYEAEQALIEKFWNVESK
jgi:L-sorbose 1-phosphate reductase